MHCVYKRCCNSWQDPPSSPSLRIFASAKGNAARFCSLSGDSPLITSRVPRALNFYPDDLLGVGFCPVFPRLTFKFLLFRVRGCLDRFFLHKMFFGERTLRFAALVCLAELALGQVLDCMFT